MLFQFLFSDVVSDVAPRPRKDAGSVLHYSCGVAGADQRKTVRNPSVSAQYAASSRSYPKRNPSCKNERGEDGIEGSNGLQTKPQYIARKVAAAPGGAGSNW